jgi:hypothetical protein
MLLQSKLPYCTHSEIGGTYTHIFNHIDHSTGEDQTGSLFLTPSFRNTPPSESRPSQAHPWVLLQPRCPQEASSLPGDVCSFSGVPWVTISWATLIA